MTHSYTGEFFDYIERDSFNSAERILPIIQKALNVQSVLDVGCGRGAWLSVWARLKVDDICGIDGAYVDQSTLHIPGAKFISHDLARPFSLNRTFDLVTSLEVAEHLPRASSEALIESLTQHSDYILFSAAVPGQGGECHINERPLTFWRALFEKKGFAPVDMLRPKIENDHDIAPWYRNNAILYVRAAKLEQAPPEVRAFIVQPQEILAKYGGLGWLIRRSIIRLLPRPVVTFIAQHNAARKARAFAKVG